MKKNDTVVCVCESLGTQGEGIAKIDGFTLFVPFFLPGERARVKVLQVKGNYGYGKIEELFTPAEERTRPKCSVFFRCGGCQLQHCRYRTQLNFKTKLVRDTLLKIGGIDFPVYSCERSDKEYAYRNKLQLPIGRVNGKNAVGFYAERSHRIVPTTECSIHPEWAGKVISALTDFMEKCGLDGYDDETGKGLLRHIVVRELKNKYLVTLVVTNTDIKGIDYFLYLLDGIFPQYSFYLNENAERTNVIFGEKFVLLRGQGFYECSEGGISFEAGANTFVQVNAAVREKLYERVTEQVEAGNRVVDCYAGGGLLTAMLAKKSGYAVGIEVVAEASACAERLKERNGLSGCMRNLCGRVEDLLPAVLEEEKQPVVILDPPRSGVDRNILKMLLQSNVKKIIYVSCNPATLARDLGILTGTLSENEKGELLRTMSETPYVLSSVQPFDMFPQTRHVETLVVLSHKKPDSHIEVKIDMDDTTLDTAAISERAEQRKPKDKPTYKKMQAWIEENYGFKVHTGYIAEVKRNEGLPMYDAPNAVEELKHPRPHPTPQMVEAIKAALKHFEII